MNEEQKYLLAVHKAMNLTMPRFLKLKSFFKNDWEAVWKAKIGDFMEAGIDKKGIETFFKKQPTASITKELGLMEKCGANILVYGEVNYPSQLENIAQPPAILFCRGEILESDFPSISVVGSRNITAYGKRALEKIVNEISSAGITIVSGLALGTDTLAQKCAIKNGARTIGVLGNGIDKIYPSTNATFGEKFLRDKEGAILSEYFPGVAPRPEYFPTRNRIVAGLSKATVVIEAAEKSGSLITAGMAVDFGKDIFAVPGEIFAKNSLGNNGLIARGEASVALSGEQILQDLGFKNLAEKKEAQKNIPQTGIEADVLALFENEKRHIDELIRLAKFPGAVVSSTVTILEIKGLVKNLGNQIYVKNF